MVRPIAFWSATLLASAALGCGGSTQQEILSPSSGSRCQLSLAIPLLPSAGVQTTAHLGAARDCTWSAQVSATWLGLSPATGQGEADLTVTAAENPQGRIRSATITINDQQFAARQEGSPCRFEISPQNVSMGHLGGRATVRLTTLEGCTWSTQSSQPWLRVVSGSGGEASATLELAVDSNVGAERSALLSVATLFVAVTQSAGPNDRTECRFSIEPGGNTVPSEGGEGSFGVATLPGCAWSPSSNQPWLVIVSSVNFTGRGEVHYRVERNPTFSSRAGVITAGTRRHVVQQLPAPRQ